MDRVVVQTRSRVATAVRTARERLPAMARDFFAAGRAAATDDNPATLHGFRIEAKRFRYSLELYGPCYREDELKDRLASIRAVQQSLGEMNDLAAVERLTGRSLAAEIARKIQEFRALWAAGLGQESAEADWVTWLSSRPKRLQKKG